jgi:hypothetical protein
MKYNSILWLLAYMAHFGSAFVPSMGPSRFAVLKSQHQDTKAVGFILWQSKNVDSASVEIADSPVHAATSNEVHTAQETLISGGAKEPNPSLRLRTLQTKRGGKLLAKEKDSAQFYEVSRMGLDSPRSSQYDTIELKSNVTDEDPSIPFDTLFSRALDTIEDAVLHARRVPYDLGWFSADSKDDEHRKTIVVLGK